MGNWLVITNQLRRERRTSSEATPEAKKLLEPLRYGGLVVLIPG